MPFLRSCNPNYRRPGETIDLPAADVCAMAATAVAAACVDMFACLLEGGRCTGFMGHSTGATRKMAHASFGDLMPNVCKSDARTCPAPPVVEFVKAPGLSLFKIFRKNYWTNFWRLRLDLHNEWPQWIVSKVLSKRQRTESPIETDRYCSAGFGRASDDWRGCGRLL